MASGQTQREMTRGVGEGAKVGASAHASPRDDQSLPQPPAGRWCMRRPSDHPGAEAPPPEVKSAVTTGGRPPLPTTSTVSRCRHGRPGSAIGPVTCDPTGGCP